VLGNHPDASKEETQAVSELCAQYKDTFAYALDDLTGCSHPSASFKPKLRQKVTAGMRRQRLSPLEQEVTNEKCQELLDNKFIREATLEDNVTYVHPVVVAAKKDSAGEWKEKRFCIDLRNTNSCTDQDPYVPDASGG
jgi:hypothetical protein